MNTETPKPGYLFVVPWDIEHPGGVNQVVTNLHDEVAKAGEFAPLILVNEWSAGRPVEKQVDGRRTIYFRLASPWPDGTLLGFVKWLVMSPILFAGLWQIWRRHRVAVFNVHYVTLAVVPIAILRGLRVYRGKLLLSFHGIDLAWALQSRPIDRALWRFVLRRTDAAIACSHAFGGEVEGFAAGATPVVVIHNGLDATRFVQSTDDDGGRLDRLAGRRFILAVATFERKKGLDVLLRAFADVRRAHPQVALALVGRRADETPELRALCTRLGLDQDVEFFENVPHSQVHSFFERAEIFCLPSRSEPFGIVLLEAGAFRLPVVASRVGGIPEIIDDGESGLLVPPDNPGALATAIARMLDDATFARAAGERLNARVRAEFTWTRAYESYKALT